MALANAPTTPELEPSRRLWLLFLGISAFSALYVFLTIIYNLFFHPLRRYPGPFLARISRLWSRIGNFHGCKSERIHAAHEKYGKHPLTFPLESSLEQVKKCHES